LFFEISFKTTTVKYTFLGPKKMSRRKESDGASFMAIPGLNGKLVPLKVFLKQFLISFCDCLENQNSEVEISSKEVCPREKSKRSRFIAIRSLKKKTLPL
jgi:hypothetical protein